MKKLGIFMFAGSLLFAPICLPINQSMASANCPVVTIYGEAKKEFVPSEATIYGRIEIVGLEKEEEDVLNIFEELKTNIEEKGGEVEPSFMYDSFCNFDGQIIYKSMLDFSAWCDVENLEECVKIIDAKENVNFQSITFTLEDDDAYNEVLSLATENAKEKAKSLLKVDNLEVENIEEICHYYNSRYKDFSAIDYDNLIENIVIEAKVKLTMKYAEEEK